MGPGFESLKVHQSERTKEVRLIPASKSVFQTQRVHLFPFRTQKLSFAVATILAWRRAGTIAQCWHRKPWKWTLSRLFSKILYWDIAKLVKAQDFDSCISLVRVQLSQPEKSTCRSKCFFQLYSPYGEFYCTQLHCVRSDIRLTPSGIRALTMWALRAFGRRI